jgi:hypothetical protein
VVIIIIIIIAYSYLKQQQTIRKLDMLLETNLFRQRVPALPERHFFFNQIVKWKSGVFIVLYFKKLSRRLPVRVRIT